jgi:hypothetical protein
MIWEFEIVFDGNIHHQGPVFGRFLVDLLGRPQEVHHGEIHTDSAPHFDHVLANGLDLLQITAHLQTLLVYVFIPKDTTIITCRDK